jgi:hypothetical protein
MGGERQVPRESQLFWASRGSVLEGYMSLKRESKNITPQFVETSRKSRKRREKELGKILKSGSLDVTTVLKEWEISYQKESFYRGVRALLELERNGKTKY